MAGPWERYASQQPAMTHAAPADASPWVRYGAPTGADLAAQGVGPGEAGILAAGKKTDNILDGLTQMYLGARGEDGPLEALKQSVAEKEASYKPLKAAHPYATGAGEALPAMAIPLGAATGLGFMAKSAAANAAPELLSYGDVGERLKGGVVGAAGGAAGAGIGLALSRVLRPAGAGAPGISREAQDAASRLGYELSPGQATQNPALQALENYLSRSPGSSGTMQAKAAANQAALNAAGAKAMGQTADNLGEPTFAAAKGAIGSEFGRLEQATAPQLGNDFLNALAKIDSANAARGSFRSGTIDNVVEKGLDLAAQGKLTGTAYKEIRSAISSDAQKAFAAQDATLGQALKSVRDALDAAAEQSLSAADQEAWKTARSQWSAYKLLSKSNVAESGNVSAPRLAAALRQQGDGLRTGAAQGPLSDVARLGEALKGVPNPTSGQLTQMGEYASPTLFGTVLAGSNKAAAAAYNTQLVRKYLAQGLIDIGADGKLILGKGSGALGNPAAKAYLGAE